MLVKTEGIVLHQLKYKESSLIVKVFTKQLGTRSYLVNGVRSQKSKNRSVIFQSLALVELEVSEKPNAQLQRINEVKLQYVYESAWFDPVKRLTVQFLSELLSTVLYSYDEDEALFNYIQHFLTTYDSAQEHNTTHMLVFLLKIASILGYGVYQVDQMEAELRDAGKSSVFDRNPLARVEMDYLLRISEGKEDGSRALKYKSVLLDHIMAYYACYFDKVQFMTSLQVIREIFSE